MKQIIFIILAIMFFAPIFSQEQNDTIICGKYRIIVQVSKVSIKHARVTNYEEGFFKIYPNMDDSYLLIHYGSMTKTPLINKDSSSFTINYQLGNIARTIRGSSCEKYFREDMYISQKITVLYENVSDSKQIYYDAIMDNIRIEPIFKNR